MPSIRVKSIGPIKDTGIIELKTINLFIGKQSTGKSTLLKIMCYCRWIEKLMCIGKQKNGRGVRYTYTHHYRFIQELIKFHRFDVKFFSQESKISYVGDTYRIEFSGGVKSNAKIEPIQGAIPYNAKLSFIPSERNLISAIKNIESWYKPKDFDFLFNFMFEWDEIRENYTRDNALRLVVMPQLEYFYDNNKGEVLRAIDRKSEFSPFYASSGVQSALPLEVMINALVQMVGAKANLSMTEIMNIVSGLLESDAMFNKDSDESKMAKQMLTYRGAILFIEEPEQNLFPESQSQLLCHMIAAIKQANHKFEDAHSMISIATHSPYILSTLNVLMAASEAYEINPERTIEIIPEKYILPKDSIGAYYITESGAIVNAIDSDIYMVNGSFIDGVSQMVEDKIDQLNDIFCK